MEHNDNHPLLSSSPPPSHSPSPPSPPSQSRSKPPCPHPPLSYRRPPPKSLRERLLHSLPPYSGPYSVGYIELELPVREPRTFSHIRRQGEHLLRLDTVLFSIYYPSSPSPGHSPTHDNESQNSEVPNDQAQKNNGGIAASLLSLLCLGRNPTSTQADRKRGEPAQEQKVRKPKRVRWLPKPRIPTCRGYAKFLSLPRMPVTAYIAVTSMFTRTHAFRNAGLADNFVLPSYDRGGKKRLPGPARKASTVASFNPAVEESSSTLDRTSTSSKLTRRRPPVGTAANQDCDSTTIQASSRNSEDNDDEGAYDEAASTCCDNDQLAADRPVFPVIIFSHGLGGSRTTYSSICGEIASQGFVVVALEHRDGSSARTFVTKQEEEEGEEESVGGSQESVSRDGDSTPSAKNTGIGTGGKNKKRSYAKVDYIFPKDNAQDTAPNNARGVDTELRSAQISMRMAEIEEAHHVLSLINAGRGPEVAAWSLRDPLDEIDWSDWTGRLRLDANVTAMGHSFGGVTSVQVLREEHRFPWLGQGILLDVWGPAMPKSQFKLRKPLISIGSEAFMHWDENLSRVRDVCEEAREGGAPAWMLTLRGSTHLSQTDFALLYRGWMSFLMKTIVHPRRAVLLTVALALEFLSMTMVAKECKLDYGAGRVSPVETEHWPIEGWLAKRHCCNRTWTVLSSPAPSPSPAPSAEPSVGNNSNHDISQAQGQQAGLEKQVPDEHRPRDEWIGMRLRIDDEFSLRMARWISKWASWFSGQGKGTARCSSSTRVGDARNRAGSSDNSSSHGSAATLSSCSDGRGIMGDTSADSRFMYPTDGYGKSLVGLKHWGVGSEVWMHCRPDEKHVFIAL